MINREDMLELTRRMTVSRTSFNRIAGAYIDDEGYVDGTFNTHFLKLSTKDKQTNINLAKTVPFSKTNEELVEYSFPQNNKQSTGMKQLLLGIRETGLKNDDLLDVFYEKFGEYFVSSGEYAIYMFHDRYDVPVKAADKERLGESEEVYEYMICIACPLYKEYTLGEPLLGFLYPAFKDRSCDMEHILVYRKEGFEEGIGVMERFLGVGK